MRYLQLTGGIERGAVTFQTGLSTASISNSGNAFTVPSSSGQLALVSQIPSNLDYVDLTTNQTAAGNKTFSGITTISNTTQSTSDSTGALIVAGGLGVAKDVYITGVANFNGITYYNAATNYNAACAIGPTGSFSMSSGSATASLSFGGLSNIALTLPTTAGALALFSQIPTNSTYVDLTTNQTIAGTKIFSDQTQPLGGIYITGTRNISTAAQLAGFCANYEGATYTDTFSTGTTTFVSDLRVGVKTLAASNVVTYTNAAAIRIGGAPIASTNVTITNPWAIQIDTGNVKLTSGVIISTANGSQTDPIYSVGGTTSGMFAGASNQLNFTTNGTSRFLITTASVQSTLQFRNASGTVGAPSSSFTSDTASGMYLIAANNPAMSAAGTNIMSYTSTKSAIGVNGSAGTPSLGFLSDVTTGLYRSAANEIAFSASGSNVWTSSSTGISVTGAVSSTTLKTGSGGTTYNQVQTGAQTLTAPNIAGVGGTHTTSTFNFSTAFSSTPKVVYNLEFVSGGTNWGNVLVILFTVSTTQYSFFLTNLGVGATTGDIIINFIASN